MRLARVLRGLADQTRLDIVNLLAAGELCVCDLEEMLEVPQPTVSRHLAYLRRSGLVAARRAGRFMYYRLAAGDPAAAVVKAVCLQLVGDRSSAARRRAAVARVKARRREPC